MKRNKRKGFTLVEIMIVVLIIGILLAIAVPNFITARRNSRLQTVIANLKQVEAGKEQCAMDTGLVVGDDCADMNEYVKDFDSMTWPVGDSSDLTVGSIGTDSTFMGKTYEEWKADPSGL